MGLYHGRTSLDVECTRRDEHCKGSFIMSCEVLLSPAPPIDQEMNSPRTAGKDLERREEADVRKVASVHGEQRDDGVVAGPGDAEIV